MIFVILKTVFTSIRRRNAYMLRTIVASTYFAEFRFSFIMLAFALHLERHEWSAASISAPLRRGHAAALEVNSASAGKSMAAPCVNLSLTHRWRQTWVFSPDLGF